MSQTRYSEPFTYGSQQLVRCRDCSSGATAVTVRADATADHDQQHDSWARHQRGELTPAGDPCPNGPQMHLLKICSHYPAPPR